MEQKKENGRILEKYLRDNHHSGCTVNRVLAVYERFVSDEAFVNATRATILSLYRSVNPTVTQDLGKRTWAAFADATAFVKNGCRVPETAKTETVADVVREAADAMEEKYNVAVLKTAMDVFELLGRTEINMKELLSTYAMASKKGE